jgi:hypothetical protein
MTKRWHALEIQLPYRIPGDQETLTTHVLAHICNKLGVKAGGLVAGEHYLRGTTYHSHYAVWVESMPPQTTLNKWMLEVLDRKKEPQKRTKRAPRQ